MQSDWGLIDTRWPLPRGRLGGGSGRLAGQGQTGGHSEAQPVRPPREQSGQGGHAAPGQPSLLHRAGPASLGSDLSFILEAMAAAEAVSAQDRDRARWLRLPQLAGAVWSEHGMAAVSRLSLPDPEQGHSRWCRTAHKLPFTEHILCAKPCLVPTFTKYISYAPPGEVVNSSVKRKKPRPRK